ncbi:hypothetical protein GEV33_010259 [Tenebrio molitor]|uniref:Cytochrome P450 monooxygenase n=1 Tax=Tenebrio molitor TaxID=7067 RepID=A0A8J6HE56_TENMO|nr:hypothetical protein GEV33_010259 [Tenebrio molitor]
MPTYIPVDPEIVKAVMQYDFNHFVDRGVYCNEEADPLSAHLFSLEGTKWRNLRIKLTPTFTSGKMKMMFDTLVKCGDQLTVEMDKTVGDSINIKDILARFTTDIIGNCAFGIDCNSLQNPDSEFTRYMKLFFTTGFWENMVGLFTFVAPDISKKFNMKIVNPILSKFFMKVIKDTVEYREKNNIHRKDFMHLLLQLKNRGKLVDDGSILNDKDNKGEDTALTMNELAAQAFEKLRQEVNDILDKYDNKLTYDGVMEMHYMEKVINETLRKYPPLPGLNRVCTKDYHVPGTDFTIEKGTKVMIPVLGIQRDPEHYPDPEKFDPERFSEENKKTRHPYTFLPFGEGPRICIGLRFGMVQTKVGLTILLKNYKFSLGSKTALPLKFDPKSFIMTTEGGIWLDYATIND